MDARPRRTTVSALGASRSLSLTSGDQPDICSATRMVWNLLHFKSFDPKFERTRCMAGPAVRALASPLCEHVRGNKTTNVFERGK
jgi:hypothetical protein